MYIQCTLDEDKTVNKTSLSAWVDEEKFPPFMYITDSNVNELAETGKVTFFHQLHLSSFNSRV